MASALRIHVRDLYVPEEREAPVLVQEYADAERWPYPAESPAYTIVELTPVRSMPFSKGLEINVLRDGDAEPDLQAGLHQYVYNVGEQPVTLSWTLRGERHEETMAPGDSAYLKPAIQHAYRGTGGKVLVLRIGGRVTGDGQMELSRILGHGQENLGRIVGDGSYARMGCFEYCNDLAGLGKLPPAHLYERFLGWIAIAPADAPTTPDDTADNTS